MASHLKDPLKRLRLRDRLAMILKLFSVLGTGWRYLDDYLVSPLAKPAFILGLVYAIINWKVIPFAWHVSEPCILQSLPYPTQPYFEPPGAWGAPGDGSLLLFYPHRTAQLLPMTVLYQTC